MVSCPLCSKLGVLLLCIGFAILLISTFDILPFQYTGWLGLGFVLSAYIVPNLVKTDTCKTGKGECAVPKQK